MTNDAGEAAPGESDSATLSDAIEAILLGGPRKYTRVEVEQLTGFEAEKARQLWRSMGFAENTDDDVVFTDADVVEIKRVAELQAEGLVDEELFLATTRFMGQSFAQLASWEGQLAIDRILGSLDPERPVDLQDTLDFANRVVPLLEQTHSYVWRRQLVAYLTRKIAQVQTGDDAAGSTMAVAFADISGYTALTRELSERDLQRLLEDFETIATFAVGAHSGRVVKMIGDAVLFSADTAEAGAEIALDMLESWAEARAQHDYPDIKVGVAHGPVISRLGDVFGSTVNIAARLTSISRPGWVVVDRSMAEALEQRPEYRLRSRRPQEVRGFNRLHSWQLTRARDETAPTQPPEGKRRRR